MLVASFLYIADLSRPFAIDEVLHVVALKRIVPGVETYCILVLRSPRNPLQLLWNDKGLLLDFGLRASQCLWNSDSVAYLQHASPFPL